MKRFFLVIIIITISHFSYSQNNVAIDSNQIKTDSLQKKEDEATLYTKADKMPEFPQGKYVWGQFIRNNLRVSVPISNLAPEGTYHVIIKFIVYKDGNLGDFFATTKCGYGMEKEAIRVLKESPKWNPALQNGHPVNCVAKEDFIFVIYGD